MTHPALVGFPVVYNIDVGWSDLDAFDHVSNLVYFRYFQDARLVYLHRIGWLQLKAETGLGPIVKSTAAKYRKPVKYPDHLQIGVRATEMQSDRVTFEHRLISQTWDAVACEGTAVLVSYDYRHATKCPLPATIRRAIEVLEGWSQSPASDSQA
ncbi:MAG: thioesterase family protein [Gemmataceae bacterium]|nr:acyl-CoA thioesterase [Gemmata sp.]MDW8196135.1 thioesterase family protein [Gemmataceae bacterium]